MPVLAALLVLLAGCGYRLRGWKAPPDVRTLAVPVFDNKTFPLRRDLEYELTDAVRKEFQARTPLRLISRESADLVVFGTITEFQEAVVGEGRFDIETEASLRIVVSLVVEDYRNDRTWTQEVDDLEPFSIQSGETLETARRRAIRNLAEKIVLAVETW